MKSEGNMKTLVYLFVGVIIALPLLMSISGLTSNYSEDQSATDTFTIEMINATSVNTSYEYELTYGDNVYENGDVSNLVIVNGSDYEFTEITDYTQNLTTGTFKLENTTEVIDSTDAVASYDYKDKEYLDSNMGRIFAGLIVGILALVILVFIVAKVIGLFGER